MTQHDIERKSASRSLAGSWTRVIVLGTVQVLAIGLAVLGVLHVRYALLLAVVLLVYEAQRALLVLEVGSRLRLLGLSAASIAVVVVGNLWRPGPLPYEAGMALLPVLLAWAFVLAAVPAPVTVQPRAWKLPTSILLPLLAGAALWLAGAAFTGGIRPWVVDEVLYLLQSQHALHPPFMQALDPSLGRFFQLQLTYVRDGYLNGQYPPAWPLLLALAPGAGTRWVLLLLVHLWVVAATYAFGTLVASRQVGFVAAFLLATSGFELYYSMSYFPHVFTAALMITAGVLMLTGSRRRGARRLVLWMTAGMLAGLGFATRPLTGMALGVALVLVVLISAPATPRFALSLLGALGAGAALPMAYLMWYNRLTTGAALRFGYTVANHGFQALGFGLRGFVTYRGQGLPVERLSQFGLGTALEHSLATLRGTLTRYWPSGLALPLLFLADYLEVRIPWRHVLPFLLLPAAYFFYFFHADRYMIELLPFGMVGTAWLVIAISRTNPRLAAAIATVLLCVHILDTGAALVGRDDFARERGPFFSAVEAMRPAHPKLLVFVDDSSPGDTEPILEALYRYNLVGSFHGDVVVARDLGPADTLLMRGYPGYYPMRLSLIPDGASEDPWHWHARLTPLSGEPPML